MVAIDDAWQRINRVQSSFLTWIVFITYLKLIEQHYLLLSKMMQSV